MKTFEKYVREQSGLNYDDLRNLNVEEDLIRNLFADWIKEDKPSMAMISIAIDTMDRAMVNF